MNENKSTTDTVSSSQNPPKPTKHITYRVRLIPEIFERDTLHQAICDLLGLSDVDVTVNTLAWDTPRPRPTREKVATITIKSKPERLSNGDTWEFKIRIPGNAESFHDVLFDKTFEEFTPIMQAEDEEVADVDCIFIHGWGGHPIGSFSSPHWNWFWPRDDLSKDFPRLRVWLYGYHSALKDTSSITSVYDHANTFRKALRPARRNTDRTKPTRPLLLVVHSLGGWILQHAMIGMANSDNADDKANLQSICGALLFGVPNQGMDVDAMMSILQAKNLPARYTASILDQQLGFSLREQHESQFHRACAQTSIKMYVFYEEEKTHTLRLDEATGAWIQDGPLVLSVNPVSATYGHYQYENKISLKKNHNNMLKFTRGDLQYRRLIDPLNNILHTITPHSSKSLMASGSKGKLYSLSIRSMLTEVGRTNLPVHPSDDERNCLQALAFPEMSSREINVTRPAEGTCLWLERNDQYVQWKTAANGILWIKGHPGTGKSTVMRHALRMSQQSSTIDFILSFFFHGTGTDLQKSLVGLYRSLLHQLACCSRDILSELTRIYTSRTLTRGKIDVGWRWEENELHEWFLEHLLNLGRDFTIHIYIDALDEINEHEALRFLSFLDQVSSVSNNKNIAVCFASRHYPMYSFKPTQEISVEKENTMDIKAYIEANLSVKNLGSVVTTPEEIVRAVLAKAGNSFQWSAIVVRRILDMARKGVRTTYLLGMIRETPRELESLYAYLLGQIDQDDKAQSLRLFQFLIFGKSALTLDDLRIALVLKNESVSLESCKESRHYCESNMAMEKRLLSLSAGLVECSPVAKSLYKYWGSPGILVDLQVTIVNLIHQSVFDFMVESGLELLGCKKEPSIAAVSQLLMARLCFFRLESHSGPVYDYRDLPESSNAQITEVDLFERDFKFQHGMSHASYFEAQRKIQTKAVSVLSDKEWAERYETINLRHLSYDTATVHVPGELQAIEAYKEWLVHAYWAWSYERQFPMFEWCFLELQQLLRELDDELDSSNAYDWLVTALDRNKNHFETLQHLDRKYGPSFQGDISTALHLGACWGVKGLVARGLAMGIDVNSRGQHQQTPLHMAVIQVHAEIVKMLMEVPEIDINLVNDRGKTPLSEACQNSIGRTPLSKESQKAIDIMALFMERDDVQVNTQDEWSGTPLMHAAGYTNIVAVKWLLDSGADPFIPDNDGWTALHWLIIAHKDGEFNLEWNWVEPHYLQTAEILIAANADVDMQDLSGWTPLHHAVQFKHVSMIALLVRHKANPCLQNSKGETPLHIAARYNDYDSIIKLLQAGADVTIRDNRGTTALVQAALRSSRDNEGYPDFDEEYSVAVEVGSESDAENAGAAAERSGAAFRILLQHDPIDASSYDRRNLCLHLRVATNDLSSVRMLLESDKGEGVIDINSQNSDGFTAVHIAACNGDIELLQYLIGQGADCDIQADNGSTALIHAMIHSQLEAVLVLLGTECYIDEQDLAGWTALHHAASRGYYIMVQKLIASKPDINRQTRDGSPALHLGDDLFIKALLLRNGADPNIADMHGLTLLHYSVAAGHLNAVRWLLRHGAKVNMQCATGQTSLHFAIATHCEVLSTLLLEHGSNANRKNKQGRTPLALLACDGHNGFQCNGGYIWQGFQCTGGHICERFQRQSPWDDLSLDDGSNLRRDWGISLLRRRPCSNPCLRSCRSEVSQEYCDHSSPQFCHRRRNIKLRSLLDLLLSHGANINTVDREGRTPLALARQFKQRVVEHWLVEHGAIETSSNIYDADHAQEPAASSQQQSNDRCAINEDTSSDDEWYSAGEEENSEC